MSLRVKKLTLWLLFVTFTVSAVMFFGTLQVSALSNRVVLEVADTAVMPGEEVTVNLTLSQGEDVRGLSVGLAYDDARLQLTGHGKLINGPDVEDEEQENLQVEVSQGKISLMYASFSGFSAPQHVYYFTFKVAEDAERGEMFTLKDYTYSHAAYYGGQFMPADAAEFNIGSLFAYELPQTVQSVDSAIEDAFKGIVTQENINFSLRGSVITGYGEEQGGIACLPPATLCSAADLKWARKPA